jgi:PPOX class probable F420-dependent enzyme
MSCGVPPGHTGMDATNLAGLYDLPLIDWARIEARLDAGLTQAPGTGGPDRHTCWLATINPDGSPHVTGIGALWADGCWWFETGRDTRKGRNLARDPRCTLSVSAREFDLSVSGEATLVTDPATVAAMAGRWAADGWPARVDDSGAALTADSANLLQVDRFGRVARPHQVTCGRASRGPLLRFANVSVFRSWPGPVASGLSVLRWRIRECGWLSRLARTGLR